MKCDEVKELIHEYIDGELSEVEARRLEKHLEGCPACALEHKQLSRISSLVLQFGVEEAPSGFMDELHAKLEKETVVKPMRSNRRMLALAATFIFAILGVAVIRYATNGTPGFNMKQAENTVVATAPDTVEKGGPAEAGSEKIPEKIKDKKFPKKELNEENNVTASEATDRAQNDAKPDNSEVVANADIAGEDIAGELPAPAAPATRAEAAPRPMYAPSPTPAPVLAAEPEPASQPEQAPSVENLDEDLAGDDAPTVARTRSIPSPSFEPEPFGEEEGGAMGEENPSEELMSARTMSRMDYGGVMREEASLLSEGDLARAQMLEALDEREAMDEMEPAAGVAPAGDVAMDGTAGAVAAGVYPGGMSVRSAVPATRPVVYSPSGGPSRGFTYYEMPREHEVIRYFVTQNVAPSEIGGEPEKDVMADVPAEGGGETEDAMAKTVPGSAGAGTSAGYGHEAGQPTVNTTVSENRQVARAVNIFMGENPIQSALECENIIAAELSSANDVLKGWERNRNYIVVQGSFKNLAPLREKIYDTFSNQPAPESATATYNIPDDYMAVLEIYFMQAN